MPSDIAARAAGDPTAEPWTRARVISALATARAELLDAIAGLTPRDAERAMGQGKWNARETVLHVVVDFHLHRVVVCLCAGKVGVHRAPIRKRAFLVVARFRRC